jgi:hypothetical protein
MRHGVGDARRWAGCDIAQDGGTPWDASQDVGRTNGLGMIESGKKYRLTPRQEAVLALLYDVFRVLRG